MVCGPSCLHTGDAGTATHQLYVCIPCVGECECVEREREERERA